MSIFSYKLFKIHPIRCEYGVPVTYSTYQEQNCDKPAIAMCFWKEDESDGMPVCKEHLEEIKEIEAAPPQESVLTDHRRYLIDCMYCKKPCETYYLKPTGYLSFPFYIPRKICDECGKARGLMREEHLQQPTPKHNFVIEHLAQV